jgi:hypothetical protein
LIEHDLKPASFFRGEGLANCSLHQWKFGILELKPSVRASYDGNSAKIRIFDKISNVPGHEMDP